MTRPTCLLFAAILLTGCRGGSGRPAAPAGEKEVDLGVIETLGQSTLADYAGRRVVLIVAAGDYHALTAKLAAEKNAVLHSLLFDLAATEDIDPSDEAGVARFVQDWIHERYYGASPGPIQRVELRQDKR